MIFLRNISVIDIIYTLSDLTNLKLQDSGTSYLIKPPEVICLSKGFGRNNRDTESKFKIIPSKTVSTVAPINTDTLEWILELDSMQ